MLYNILRVVARFIHNIVYYPEIIGIENIPDQGPLIIVGNHKSLWDPIFLTSYVKNRKIHWMGKEELWKNKFLAFFLDSLGAFPVNRKSADIDAVKKSLRILKNNEVLGIFPEGTRVKKFDESMIKSGTGMIAQKTGSIVVPIYIEGDYKLFKQMKIKVRKPISFKEMPKLSNEGYRELSVDLMKKVYFGD